MIDLSKIPSEAQGIRVLLADGRECNVVKVTTVNPQRFVIDLENGEFRVYNQEGVNQFAPQYNLQRIEFFEQESKVVTGVTHTRWWPRLYSYTTKGKRRHVVQENDVQGLMNANWYA